jgi:hypothetical protein
LDNVIGFKKWLVLEGNVDEEDEVFFDTKNSLNSEQSIYIVLEMQVHFHNNINNKNTSPNSPNT